MKNAQDKNSYFHLAFPAAAFNAKDGVMFHAPGLTKREYAAIHLRLPDSGIDWLDDMIALARKYSKTDSVIPERASCKSSPPPPSSHGIHP